MFLFYNAPVFTRFLVITYAYEDYFFVVKILQYLRIVIFLDLADGGLGIMIPF